MLPEKVYTSLKKIAASNNFSDYEVVVNSGSSSGDGYLSVIKSVTLKDKNSESELNLIIKLAPPPPPCFEGESPSTKQFQREIYFYDNILPAFSALVADFSAPDLLNAYIKCHETALETGKEYLIFDNIKLQGYNLWPAEQPLSQQLVTLVCQQIGKFHALSFALHAKKPAVFSEFYNAVKLPALDLNPDGLSKKIRKEMYTNASRALGEGTARMEAYKRAWQQSKFHLFQMHEHLSSDQFMAILHGDSWLNNILFKYDASAQPIQPSDLKLLDFQIMVAGPSTCDLACFLFICCEKTFLVDLKKYLDVYYDAVVDTLRKLDCDPSTVFPRKVFDQQWREFSPFGLMAATIFIKFMLFDKEEKKGMEKCMADPKSTFMEQEIHQQAEYNRRMQDLVDILLEHDLL